MNFEGIESYIANTGNKGITFAIENYYNQRDIGLILLDVGLPDIDGQTVIGVIKQQPTLNDMVVLAFTAWPPEEARDMAARYGCDGVITKPIQTRTFANEVMAFLLKKQEALERKIELQNLNLQKTQIEIYRKSIALAT